MSGPVLVDMPLFLPVEDFISIRFPNQAFLKVKSRRNLDFKSQVLNPGNLIGALACQLERYYSRIRANFEKSRLEYFSQKATSISLDRICQKSD